MMDNKIILQLIRKDLDELQLLIEAFQQEDNLNSLFIEIALSKVQTLQNELNLLSTSKKPSAPVLYAEPSTTLSTQAELIVEVAEKTISVENLSSISIPEEAIQVEEKPEISSAPIPEQKAEVQEIVPKAFAKPIEEVIPERIIIEEKVEIITTEEITSTLEMVKPDSLPLKENAPEHEKKILAEKFTKEPSLNEKLASLKTLETKIKAKPITNLKTAIGLNDKFLYQRELFENNHEIFDQAIHTLDSLSNVNEAIEYLEKNFHWNKNETSLKFIELIKRRFQN